MLLKLHNKHLLGRFAYFNVFITHSNTPLTSSVISQGQLVFSLLLFIRFGFLTLLIRVVGDETVVSGCQECKRFVVFDLFSRG
jgi:hypothetical protein